MCAQSYVSATATWVALDPGEYNAMQHRTTKTAEGSTSNGVRQSNVMDMCALDMSATSPGASGRSDGRRWFTSPLGV